MALVPVDVGLNVICTAWLCPADKEKLPPETMEYWVVLMVHVPERVPPPVLVTVKADKVFVWPTVTEPKLTTVVGVMVMVGGSVETEPTMTVIADDVVERPPLSVALAVKV